MKPVRVVGVAMLLLPVASVSCAQQSNEALVFTIEQTLNTNTTADFGRLVPGDWTTICVFRPGTPYATVDSALGKSWGGVQATEIEARDDVTLLVFHRDGVVIEHVLFPVPKGDFGTPGPEQWYCLPRASAVFEIRHPIEGRIPWIGPVRGW